MKATGKYSGGFCNGKIKERGVCDMDRRYTLVNRFHCGGKNLVTVLIKGKAACVMTEQEYNDMIKTEHKHGNKNITSVA